MQLVLLEIFIYIKIWKKESLRCALEYCSAVVDGANQLVFGLPHFMTMTKGIRRTLLKVCLIRVHEHCARKHRFSLFTSTDEFRKGVNYIIEKIVSSTVEEVKTHFPISYIWKWTISLGKKRKTTFSGIHIVSDFMERFGWCFCFLLTGRSHTWRK